MLRSGETMVEARLRVIYGDTDQMGYVYYANYLRYFEVGRSEYFRAKGGRYQEIEAGGTFLPVVEAHLAYRSPARYDDVLLIRTRVQELRGASVEFGYEILRESEMQLLCTGTTRHACTNRAGKPVRVPENLVGLLETAGPSQQEER